MPTIRAVTSAIVARELMNLAELGHYLNVSAERARQVAADNPTSSNDEGETASLEPRQGRAMGRAALVGYAAVEETAVNNRLAR